jgi:hypothetical protein
VRKRKADRLPAYRHFRSEISLRSTKLRSQFAVFVLRAIRSANANA